MTNTRGNRQYNKLRNAIKGITTENISGLEFACFSVSSSPDGDYSQRCYVSHRWNSPTFSREWLCTEEPAGCFGLRGPQTRRKDSSLRLSPHSSDGLQWERESWGGALSQTCCVGYDILQLIQNPGPPLFSVCPSPHHFPAFHPPTTPHLCRDTRPQWSPGDRGRAAHSSLCLRGWHGNIFRGNEQTSKRN